MERDEFLNEYIADEVRGTGTQDHWSQNQEENRENLLRQQQENEEFTKSGAQSTDDFTNMGGEMGETAPPEEPNEHNEQTQNQIGMKQGGKASQKGKSKNFDSKFIKAHYQDVRNHKEVAHIFDKINEIFATKMTALTCGMDNFFFSIFKPEYLLMPMNRFDIVVDIVFIDDVTSGAFEGFMDVLDDILLSPLVKPLGDQIVKAAEAAGILKGKKSTKPAAPTRLAAG
jgi:hypothetical protein